ncbi:MAG: tetratricopeptide repeat protein [Candidatus Eisenbacteria bacterium]|nr:tetratricopeptide repeat protein [Candidatus Eisenbacteria bacterium]
MSGVGGVSGREAELGGWRRWGLRTGVLFLVPLLIRAVVHRQLSGDPFYAHLFVDARIYHEIARVLADGSQQMTGPHWQPPFYPTFVSWIYRAFGPDPDAVRWVQMVFGSIGAVWVHGIATRLVSARAGWIAWAAVAFSGPLVFFDLQLLPASLAVFLLLAVVRLLVAYAKGDGQLRRFGAWGFHCTVVVTGVLSGLAALTVGNLILLPALAVPWLLARGDRGKEPGEESGGKLEGERGGKLERERGRKLEGERERDRRGASRIRGVSMAPIVSIAIFLIAWCAPLLWNTAQNYEVSHEFIPISYNGGINFWIGNNPNYDDTVAIRPGRAWQRLTAEPLEAGKTGYRAQSDFFFEKSSRWMADDPGAAMGLLAKKTHLFLRGDELARNQEIYPFRLHSSLLSVLLFVHGIAFPSGLLLPLALVGVCVVLTWPPRGSVGPLRILAGFTILYGASVVAFFVTSRYRVPLYPLFAVFGGLAVDRFLGLTGVSARTQRVTMLVLLAAGLLIANLGVPKMAAEPSSDTRYDLGLAYQMEGATEKAMAEYETAIRLNPENTEAHNNLAGLLLSAGDAHAARRHLESVVRAYPGDVSARLNLTRACLALGDLAAARRVIGPVAERLPGDERVRALLNEISRAESRSSDR